MLDWLLSDSVCKHDRHVIAAYFHVADKSVGVDFVVLSITNSEQGC